MPLLRGTKPSVIRFGDTYYESSKVFLWFGMVAGVFPISRNPAGTYRFRWISTRTFYSIFIYVITSCTTAYSTYIKIRNFRNPELPFDEYLFTLIFIVILSPHWLFQTVSLPSSKGLSEYLTMWSEFQKHFLLVTGSTIKLDYGMKFINILIFGTIMAVVTPIAQTYMMKSFTMLESVGFYHTLVISNFFCAWWCLQCNAFVSSVRRFREIMRKELAETPMYLDISRYRDLWERIYALTEKLSSSMGRLYGVYNLFTYLSLFASVYCTVAQILNGRDAICLRNFVGFLVSVIYFSILAYAFCNAAHFLEEEIADGVRNDLLLIRVHRLSDSNARQVNSFLNTINANKIGVIVSGNFKIGRGTVTHYVSSMAMYCLVLLQFKIALPAGGGNQTDEEDD